MHLKTVDRNNKTTLNLVVFEVLRFLIPPSTSSTLSEVIVSLGKITVSIFVPKIEYNTCYALKSVLHLPSLSLVPAVKPESEMFIFTVGIRELLP